MTLIKEGDDLKMPWSIFLVQGLKLYIGNCLLELKYLFCYMTCLLFLLIGIVCINKFILGTTALVRTLVNGDCSLSSKLLLL